jgi:hypothetical protein
MFEILLAALKTAENSFNPDELAFLALTSKIENPFRDRLAYALVGPAVAAGGRIAREYRRADIAWITPEAPKALIELKACYTRDLITQADVYMGHLRTDLCKPTVSNPSCQRFAILLATHPCSTIHRGAYDTLKYAGKVNEAIRKVGSPELVKARAQQIAIDRRGRIGRTHSFCWGLGTYLGVQVELLGWLVQPPAIGAT